MVIQKDPKNVVPKCPKSPSFWTWSVWSIIPAPVFLLGSPAKMTSRQGLTNVAKLRFQTPLRRKTLQFPFVNFSCNLYRPLLDMGPPINMINIMERTGPRKTSGDKSTHRPSNHQRHPLDDAVLNQGIVVLSGIFLLWWTRFRFLQNSGGLAHVNVKWLPRSQRQAWNHKKM